MVAEAIDDVPPIDDYDSLINTDILKLPAHERRELEAAGSAYARRLRGIDPDPGDLSYPRSWDRNSFTGLMRTRHERSSVQRFRVLKVGETDEVSRYYRLDPYGLCSTLRAGTGYERGSFMAVRPIHPSQSRVIAVREAARLHSFPDWFGFHVTKWHGFRQIGNSLPPLLGRAVANEIARALRVRPAKPKRVIEIRDRSLLELATYAAGKRFDADLDVMPSHARRLRKPKRPETAAPRARRTSLAV
jgi:DNA (cytosine-5)-methyltransferase 1